VGIPVDTLRNYKDKFPGIKSAHIIFYSDNSKEIDQAVRTLGNWGYIKVTGLPGGVTAWKSAGYKTVEGPALSEINYVRKLNPGEISITDFKKSIDVDTIIVDVRTPEEYSHGHFQRAVNIPVDELPLRLAELSKDSSIITHCRTGVRAEMAFNILKGKGYNVKFLKARPEFRADGAYDIVEW
jgi:rhodanese-related sulfurtransferase